MIRTIVHNTRNLFGKARNRLGLATAAAIAGASTASASGPSYVVDIGIEPTDIVVALIAVLVPFLIAAIGLKFGFYAVQQGLRWVRGAPRG